MPLSEQEALQAAQMFVQKIRRDLAYPVCESPTHKSLARDTGKGKFAGRDVWTFGFDYMKVKGSVLEL